MAGGPVLQLPIALAMLATLEYLAKKSLSMMGWKTGYTIITIPNACGTDRHSTIFKLSSLCRKSMHTAPSESQSLGSSDVHECPSCTFTGQLGFLKTVVHLKWDS